MGDHILDRPFGADIGFEQGGIVEVGEERVQIIPLNLGVVDEHLP